MPKQRHPAVLITFILLFVSSVGAHADNEYVYTKEINGITYHNVTKDGPDASFIAEAEATRAKAQAEADVKSQVWRERMDAAASGHPDANFEADNKANYDLWAASHPAEVAQGIREQAALAARGAEMAEQMKVESARNLEEFHQKMLAEGRARGIDGEKAFKFAIGESNENPYDLPEGVTYAELARFKAAALFGQTAQVSAPTIMENPRTLSGTPVGLSGFDSPPLKKTVQLSASDDLSIKQSMAIVKVDTAKAPTSIQMKALISLESKPHNS